VAPEGVSSLLLTFAVTTLLQGRVRVAPEGVNVVLDGLARDLQTYMDAVLSDGRWGDDVTLCLMM
jgi:hypothetical protein